MANHPGRSKRVPTNRVGLVQIALARLKEAREALRAARVGAHATIGVSAAIRAGEALLREVAGEGDGLETLATRRDFDGLAKLVRVRVWDTERWRSGKILAVAALDARGHASAWAIALDNGTRGTWGRDHVELLP